MPIVLDGSQGISTPMYAGSITSNPVTPSVNMKNRLINSAMVIDQRNAGAALTGISSSVYCLDRWKFSIGGTGTFTVQQSSTAPTGFANSLAITCTAAQASPAVLYAEQKIEGFNLQDLAYNTANAISTTLSFWVRSSKTGTFVALLYNTSASRMIGRTYTINVANTWEQKTVTFTGDTSGAIPNSNANGLEIRFWLAAGSTWSSGTLPTTWAADVTANQAAGQTVNLADTIGNTLYITGVQLEVGSTATSFDYRPYGTELALCQRYYVKGMSTGATAGTLYATTAAAMFFKFPVTMRTAPTSSLTTGTTVQLDVAGLGNPIGTLNTFDKASEYGCRLLTNINMTGTIGQPAQIDTNVLTVQHSAEL